MKKAAIVLVVTFMLISCAPKESWDYVVIGDNRQLLSTAVSQYAGYIEQDQGVKVVIFDVSEKSTPASWMLRNMQYHDEFREAIAGAEVITINWPLASVDLIESNYIKGECGGADNEECLREGYAKTKEDWAGMLDAVASLRNGSPTIIRILVVGDWVNETNYYSKQLTVEQIAIFNSYLADMQKFISADADLRGIPVLFVFPEPYFNDEAPPDSYFESEGIRLSDNASKLIADDLRELGYDFIVLK